jgi:hypothetical protein
MSEGGEAFRLRRLAEALNEQRKALESFQVGLEFERETFEREWKQAQDQIDLLLGARDDHVVLVHTRPTGGTAVTRYHSTNGTCGWVNSANRANYEELLESEARQRRLRRCTACMWTARVSV